MRLLIQSSVGAIDPAVEQFDTKHIEDSVFGKVSRMTN